MTERTKVEIIREVNTVTIAVHCGDTYEAMQLYDRLIQGMKDGLMKLDITAVAATAHEDRK